MSDSRQENSFKTILLSHNEAPVDIREKFAFSDEQSRAFLLHLREVFGIREALLVSTCNRTELYYYDSTPAAEVLPFFCAFRAFPSDQALHYFRLLEETPASVLHLLRMGIGLESQVLGDLQIINQVKVAYQLTADLDMAGPFLHRLLHALFFLNKRIVQETRFRSGSASVSYATKELAEDLVQDKTKPVLVIGLGEIGVAVLRNLQENGFSNIRIANRTPEKAAEFLAQGMEFIPLEAAAEAMATSTLTISALSGTHFQAGPEVFAQSNALGFQYCIDLGMPRSIDPAVEQNPRIILYNVDQIQTKVSEALAMRQQAVPLVEAIVNEGFAEFMDWSRDMAVSPLIQQMKSALEVLRKEEMARFLKKAGEEQAAWAEELTKNMVQRIMKSHIVQLKTACRRGDAETLTDALSQLFQVEAGTQV